MNGWSNFKIFVNTYKSVLFVDELSILNLENSIYPSQKSSQIKLYSSVPTFWNSYLSIFFLTSLIVLLSLVNIHLSLNVRLEKSYSFTFSIFINVNLDAFHILFIKFQVDFIFSSSNLKSWPGAELVVKKYLSASHPYSSIISIGSIPLPKLLLIFLPSLSRISPCIIQSLNGTSLVNSSDWNIILDTQKNIIS